MSTKGYLSQFSLAELFHFIDQGNKTGLLKLEPLDNDPQGKKNYVWFRQGHIVAAAHHLDNQGLISMINKRGWVNQELGIANIRSVDRPLGLYLKSLGLIDAEQLKLLFTVQVMRTVCDLFSLKDAWFEFNPQTDLSLWEMTGLNSSTTNITLAGLRSLRDWTALQEKLPESTSALISTIHGEARQSINKSEKQIWELADGVTTLKEISKQLELPFEKVQHIAFRLMVIGLAEEIPMVENSINLTFEPETQPETESNAQEASSLSQNFLENLSAFLSGHV